MRARIGPHTGGDRRRIEAEAGGTGTEIFLSDRAGDDVREIGQVGLEIDNVDALLEKCAAHGVQVTAVPRNNKTLISVKDFDGSLFEIKPRL